MAKQVVAVALNDYVDKYSLCISLCLLVSFVWSLSHQFKRPETLLASTFRQFAFCLAQWAYNFRTRKAKQFSKANSYHPRYNCGMPSLFSLNYTYSAYTRWIYSGGCQPLHVITLPFLSYIIVEMQCFFVCLFFVCL